MSATATSDLYRTDSAARSSRIAFGALLLRDLWVLRKNLRAFIPRTIVQPLLLCFVFLYVFPTIGTGVGGGRGGVSESGFATILVAGVIGLSIMPPEDVSPHAEQDPEPRDPEEEHEHRPHHVEERVVGQQRHRSS